MTGLVERGVLRLKSTRFVNHCVRYNPRYYREVRRVLRDLDEMDRDGRRELSNRLTARALGWARSSAAGSNRGASLDEWPILEKAALRESVDQYVVPKYSWIADATAGTTGPPVAVHRSLRCLAAGQAFIDDLLGVWDLTFGSSRVVRLRNDPCRPLTDNRPPYGAYRSRRRTLMLSSRHLSAETAPWFHQAIQAFRPDLLYAYPAFGEELSTLFNSLGLSINIPLILTSSQALPVRTRRQLEESFNTTVIDFYNQVERVSFAAGVAVGAYYFNPAYGRVELIAVPDSETQSGYRAFEIVATGFWNEAMPLVRYRTEDLAIVPESYTPSDIDDVALGLKPVAAIRRRRGQA